MTAPMPPNGGEERARPRVDARQLWAGGVATAVVAGLIALVGVLISRWLLKIPLLSPQANGAYGNVHTTDLVLVAVFAALVATALAHLLLLSTPRPMVFFGWIVGLVTLAAMLFPFSTTATLQAKGATAVVLLVLGVAIGSLIGGVAARSVRRRNASRGYPAVPPGRYRPAAPESVGRYRPAPQERYRPAAPESAAEYYRPGAPESAPEYHRPAAPESQAEHYRSVGPDSPPSRYRVLPPEPPQDPDATG